MEVKGKKLIVGTIQVAYNNEVGREICIRLNYRPIGTDEERRNSQIKLSERSSNI